MCTCVAGVQSFPSASVSRLRATPGDEVLSANGGKVACGIDVPV
jgi:hypothetical protein